MPKAQQDPATENSTSGDSEHAGRQGSFFTIPAAQARRHVAHYEALRPLYGLVQLSVLERDLTAPPGSPTDGDRYIVGSGATGGWAGWDLNVALWTDGEWLRLPPRTGLRAWSEDEGLRWIRLGRDHPDHAAKPRVAGAWHGRAGLRRSWFESCPV